HGALVYPAGAPLARAAGRALQGSAGGLTERRRGAGARLPLGVLRRRGQAVLPLAHDAAPAAAHRVRRRARARAPAGAPPHARVLDARGAGDAGFREKEEAPVRGGEPERRVREEIGMTEGSRALREPRRSLGQWSFDDLCVLREAEGRLG